MSNLEKQNKIIIYYFQVIIMAFVTDAAENKIGNYQINLLMFCTFK